MSRIHEALKKASRHRPHGSWAGGLDGRRAPTIAWDHDAGQVEYERIQVWLGSVPPPPGRGQAVFVAGCHSGCGATTTATRLAATLAARPRARVLIVDTNLRTPCLDLVFRAQPVPGFSEALGGAASEAIQPTPRANFFVLTAGRTARTCSEMFGGLEVGRLIDDVRARFDYVVLDGAPLLEFPDGYAIAPHVDGVVLVLESDRTPIDAARRVARDLDRVGAPRVGVVLNRQRDYVPKAFRRLLHQVA